MSQTDEFTIAFIPPSGVGQYLPAVMPNIQECYKDSPHGFDHQAETTAFITGRISLWVALKGPELVGHLATSIYSQAGKSYIHLPHLWARPGAGKVIEAFVPFITSYARSVNAKGITYRTGRSAKAFARRLRDIGMRPALVEFFMEVE